MKKVTVVVRLGESGGSIHKRVHKLFSDWFMMDVLLLLWNTKKRKVGGGVSF